MKIIPATILITLDAPGFVLRNLDAKDAVKDKNKDHTEVVQKYVNPSNINAIAPKSLLSVLTNPGNIAIKKSATFGFKTFVIIP
ncbi:hypothetical protein IX317_002253 [Fusobacterium sp. DD29]|nr:hypothetical protein [Fusobacterium sp. DD29]MBR8762778.1 hypothetical protein [Fusobacterium sp. DD25]MBR8768795.1 hypothetical protein [Fusobacterium sp. DD43]MBR8772876.1 hypothetical protein [Fusobacterium sp. DD40]MBR8801558.1 hypothetical protein [Fusobacterium sp. DD10]MBR8812991.1 hypothetical protein [Fusobacterium sp. DD14]MBR8815205.1 hypothetical protein [Fusobacterium sp. DD6]MBR8821745.1 hypothetical protein [Fusobacterium sp. DD3]MBR8826258.1 hypothetical protein [Fusobact